MTSPSTAGSKRRSISHQPTVEDQELNLISQEAESRLANSHAVLVEARKIRTHERERLRQAENDENEEIDEENEQKTNGDIETHHSEPEEPKLVEPKPDEPKPEVTSEVTPEATPEVAPAPGPAAPDVTATVAPQPAVPPVAAITSKRGSADDVYTNGIRTRIPVAVQSSVDLEERYKRVMLTNAQLDNDKQVLQYEVELLKDRLADENERYLELQHQHSITCRELAEQKNSVEEWKTKSINLQELLTQRDTLIKEHGLLFVSVGEPEALPSTAGPVSSALLSLEFAELLSDYEGTLGERLGKFFQDKMRLEAENKRLQQDLELEKSRASLAPRFPMSADGISVPGSPAVSGMDTPFLDVETQKNVTEYKLKLKRAEQEITTLQGAVTRLECQVTRYKTAAETSEKNEEDLKQEKRRLQKELREAQTAVQELETKNGHMMKRLEKAKYRNVTDAN